MNNVEIYIVTEGQTERTFVRDILAPYTAKKGIYLYATLIGKPGHKGGDIRFERAKTDVGNLLKQRQNIYVSTMFDYFRLDSGWPGMSDIRTSIQNGTLLKSKDKAKIIEEAANKRILNDFSGCDAKKRFIPYIEMHEFEALLFSDADRLSEETGIAVSKINEIIMQYENPEEINDSPQGAPSKRLECLCEKYDKIDYGKTIAESIGIENIREKCPHFDDWLKKFEELTGEADGKN